MRAAHNIQQRRQRRGAADEIHVKVSSCSARTLKPTAKAGNGYSYHFTFFFSGFQIILPTRSLFQIMVRSAVPLDSPLPLLPNTCNHSHTTPLYKNKFEFSYQEETTTHLGGSLGVVVTSSGEVTKFKNSNFVEWGGNPDESVPQTQHLAAASY